jgi:hypothetical protein
VNEPGGKPLAVHLDPGSLGQFREQLIQIKSLPPGEVAERFQVSELRGPVFRLAVAAQHLATTGVVRGHLADGHVGPQRWSLRPCPFFLGPRGSLGIGHCRIVLRDKASRSCQRSRMVTSSEASSIRRKA